MDNTFDSNDDYRKYKFPDLTGLIPETYNPEDDPDYMYKTAKYGNGREQVAIRVWEKFKPYPPMPEFMVSNLGRVYNPNFNNGRLMSLNRDKDGYIQYHLNHGKFNPMAHDMLMETFHPNPDPDKYDQINHYDGFIRNNYFISEDNTNLEWSNTQDNIKHAFDTGLRERMDGEHNPTAVLKEPEVEKVCQLITQGYGGKEIAEIMGWEWNSKTQSRIAMIRTGRCWTNISSKYNITDYCKRRK